MRERERERAILHYPPKKIATGIAIKTWLFSCTDPTIRFHRPPGPGPQRTMKAIDLHHQYKATPINIRPPYPHLTLPTRFPLPGLVLGLFLCQCCCFTRCRSAVPLMGPGCLGPTENETDRNRTETDCAQATLLKTVELRGASIQN